MHSCPAKQLHSVTGYDFVMLSIAFRLFLEDFILGPLEATSSSGFAHDLTISVEPIEIGQEREKKENESRIKKRRKKKFTKPFTT